ncbi:MAG: type II toxin-antitoxin system RelE/ParE family toxin [Candidatus Levybacteria bacterium]|nr:type II toxin-antitoxin system RelE/ParE family toxin [Candidatus Levybacteria bacterium]
MKAKPLNLELLKYLRKHNLEKKFNRQLLILRNNARHPSLHTEILEPKSRKIYSFRVDLKYRAIFFVKDGEIEIVDINDHYQ